MGLAVEPVRELASGIDALYLSGHGVASPSLLRSLAVQRAAAEDLGCGVPIDFGDGRWVVEPKGWLRYRYSLTHPHGRLGVTDKLSIPPLRMQPLSEYLHGVGIAEALAWAQSQAEAAVSRVRLTGARLDVYADWQGWEPRACDLERFVRRADHTNIRECGAEWTGFDIGRRKSGTVLARIYDKSRQVHEEGKDWWYAVWGDAYNPMLRVVRVEFEVGRLALREFGLDGAAETVEKAPALWASLTQDWLTLREPTGDQTRARWPVAMTWQQIQAASFAANAVGLERIRKGRNAGSLRTLTPALVGYIAKAGALLGAETLEETLELLHEHIWTYGDRRGMTFEERVREKSAEVAA